MYGRRTSGITTEPSACCRFSSTATSARPAATPDPFSVCTGSSLPVAGFRQRACIRQVSDRDPELLRYLDRSGLVLGTRIRISEKAPFRGPIRLDVFERGEQHIGLDVAEAIYVDVIE